MKWGEKWSERDKRAISPQNGVKREKKWTGESRKGVKMGEEALKKA